MVKRGQGGTLGDGLQAGGSRGGQVLVMAAWGGSYSRWREGGKGQLLMSILMNHDGCMVGAAPHDGRRGARS